MKRKSAFNGVVVLTVALIVVKILSALYRVPYQNVLGDAGLYAYQQIYPLVALGVILSMHALPSATTQMLGTQGDAARYTRVLTYVQIAGVATFGVILATAPYIAQLMGDVQLTPMIRVASSTFLVVGALGILRAHYQARQSMHIPAYSQVIEQVIRVAVILVTVVVFYKSSLTIYEAGSIALFGSILGFIASTLYLMIKRPFKLQWHSSTPVSLPWRHFIFAVMIFAASQLIVILWQILDNFTIVNVMKHTGAPFQQLIEEKGVYDRGASFIQMGLIVTTTFCFVLIPLLTDAFRQGAIMKAHRYANVSLKITVVISVAASAGLINLMPLMNHVFFKDDVLTSTLIVYMLSVIGVSWVMLEMALLQVVHRKRFVLISLMISACMKFIMNIVFLHHFGIIGASISTVVSLFIFAFILHIATRKHYRFEALHTFLWRLFAAIVCMSIAVQGAMYVMPELGRFGGLIELLILAVIGIAVLLLCVMYMHILTYKELRYLPFGNIRHYFKRGKKR